MPRINPVPQREREIGARLRQFRNENLKFSQVVFARELEIDSTRLATYEHGRVPLRYSVARRACEHCGINPQWLATGSGEREVSVPLPEPKKLSVSEEKAFSEVYDLHIAKHFSLSPDLFKADTGGLGLDPDVYGRLNNIEWMCGIIRGMFASVPNSAVLKLRRGIQDLVHDLLQEPKDAWDEELRRAVEMRWLLKNSEGKESSVDKLTEKKDNAGVRLTWAQLKNRLKTATKPRGKRAELARLIGVSEANVNRWLVKDVEPGAEATFRLLEWVTAEEAKQKNSGTGVTAPESKTQRKDTNESKLKSGRKKK